jgi:5-methylcytosine-specific restriction endonuclease McrA
MTTRPTVEIRRQVVERAENCCEYCLLHQDLAASTHQVDHVIAEKHGGQTSLDNLALSCMVWI